MPPQGPSWCVSVPSRCHYQHTDLPSWDLHWTTVSLVGPASKKKSGAKQKSAYCTGRRESLGWEGIKKGWQRFSFATVSQQLLSYCSKAKICWVSGELVGDEKVSFFHQNFENGVLLSSLWMFLGAYWVALFNFAPLMFFFFFYLS